MTDLSDDEFDPAMEVENDNNPVLFVNQFLPPVEREAVQVETKESEAEISRSLDFMTKDVERGIVPEVRSIGKCLRLIGGHYNRKYLFSDEIRMKIVEVLLTLYRHRSYIVLSLRTRLLSTIQLMLQKHWSPLSNFFLDWREFWSELHSLVGREERFELRSCESPLTSHATKLASFLLSVRHYFTPFPESDDQSGLGSLLESAMNTLSDLKQFHVAEGPLMILCCLSSQAYSLPQVQALLPQWFNLWASIDRNAMWDLCWIVILSRAAKYGPKSGGFDWSSRVPFLLSKLRELLKLPASEQARRSGSSHSHGGFPRSFGAQYGLYISGIKDTQEMQVKKLVKTLLQIIARDDNLTVTAERLGITPPAALSAAMEVKGVDGYLPGFTESSLFPNVPSTMISKSTAQVMEFLIALRPFIHPSNSGQYVGNIAAVTSWILRTVSAMAGDKAFETVFTDRIPEEEKKLTIPVSTLRFLTGTCLTMIMEGIYTKNTMASRRFAMSLKHIVSLEPSSVHLLMPFFLSALEGKGTSHQPGHTIVALVAVNAIFRVAMYPQPHMLLYVPELLKLLLPGVDAADSMKTAATFDLLSTLFSVLPVSFKWSPKVIPLKSYRQLLESDLTAISKLPLGVKDIAINEQYETFVTYVTSDWTAAVFERIFILIEGQEQKIKGAKDSNISSLVAYFVGFFFQAFSSAEVNNDELSNGPLKGCMDSVEKLMLDFAMSSRPPTHTDKVCSKLFEQYLYCRPSRLEPVLVKLLMNSDPALKGLAADKLAFRLRLIGGCLRQAQGQQSRISEPVFNRLQSLAKDKTLLHHEDNKAVRKATMKLAKDFLKGCLTSYIVNVYPVRASSSILAEPIVIKDVEDIVWYSPDANELAVGVSFLKSTLENSLQELHSALDQVLTIGQLQNDDGNAPLTNKMSVKQCEEAVASQFGLLRRLIRGAAELIIDSMDANKKGLQIPETGRSAYLNALSDRPELQQYLRELRNTLLTALLASNEKILHEASPLKNSEVILKQWMKLAGLVVTRRVAFLKATEPVKKWIQYLNATSNSIFAEAVSNRCRKAFSFVNSSNSTTDKSASTLLTLLQDPMYWKKHDWNTNTLSVAIVLQRQTRGIQYGYSTRRQLEDDDLAFFVAHRLLDLTRHEYDAVRPAARKTLEIVLSGMKYEFNQDMTRQLLSAAGNENGTYYTSASALVMLKQNLFAKRIATDSDLKIVFLKTILPVYRCAAAIEEPDKREKLLLALTDCLLKYTQVWTISEKELENLRNDVLPALLARVVDANTGNVVSYGLRLDAILGYVLLHLISPELSRFNPFLLLLFLEMEKPMRRLL